MRQKPLPDSATPSAEISFTIRDPPFTYLLLELYEANPRLQDPQSAARFDLLVARTHLTSALQQFLGSTGSAIPVDILNLEGNEVLVRVPREDANGVVTAVSGWIGRSDVAWRVKRRGDVLAAIVGDGGRDLFHD